MRPRRADGWALRVPLTTAPATCAATPLPGTPRGNRWPCGEIRASLRAGRNDTGAEAVQSRTHRLDVEPAGALRQAGRRRDAARPRPGADLADAARAEPPDVADLCGACEERDEAHLLVLVSAPRRRRPHGGPAARGDPARGSSGSMSGPKWEAADWAVNRFLSDLGPQESFALGVFHSATRWFSPAAACRDRAGASGGRVPGGREELRRHRTGSSARAGLGHSGPPRAGPGTSW